MRSMFRVECSSLRHPDGREFRQAVIRVRDPERPDVLTDECIEVVQNSGPANLMLDVRLLGGDSGLPHRYSYAQSGHSAKIEEGFEFGVDAYGMVSLNLDSAAEVIETIKTNLTAQMAETATLGFRSHLDREQEAKDSAEAKATAVAEARRRAVDGFLASL